VSRVRELMGVKEVAAELGVLPSNIYRVPGLPEPLYAREFDPPRKLAAGSFWDADEVREFAAARRERKKQLA